MKKGAKWLQPVSLMSIKLGVSKLRAGDKKLAESKLLNIFATSMLICVSGVVLLYLIAIFILCMGTYLQGQGGCLIIHVQRRFVLVESVMVASRAWRAF